MSEQSWLCAAAVPDGDDIIAPSGHAIPSGYRIVGCRRNAGLIVVLGRTGYPVWLAPTAAAGDPAGEVAWLRQPPRSVGTGAWRLLTPALLASYAFLADPQLPLAGHPAWPLLSFVPDSAVAAALVVRAIGDPDWYAHSIRPGRLTRLYAALRLQPGATSTALTLACECLADRCPGLRGSGRSRARRFVGTLSRYWSARNVSTRPAFRPELAFAEDADRRRLLEHLAAVSRR